MSRSIIAGCTPLPFLNIPENIRPMLKFELNHSRKTVLEKLNAQLSSSRPTHVERGAGEPPMPAEEFTAVDRNNLEYHVLTVFDGKRPIQLLAGIPKTEKRPAAEDVGKFFASLNVEPKQ
jgi:hypothetical protein